jgi:hypothetical protein
MHSIFRVPTSLGLAVAIVVSVANPLAAPAASPALVLTAATADAAPLYRQAVEQIAAIADDSLPDPETPLDVAAAERFLLEHRGVLDRLERAGEIPACTWNQPHELADTAMLGKLRHLAAIGMLQARVDFARKHPEKAADDLLAVMSLSRHIGQTPLLISKLVEIGVAEDAIKEMAAALPGLPKDVAATIPQRLKKLPRSATSADVILGEHAYAANMVKNPNGAPVGFSETAIRDARGFYEAIAKSGGLAPTEFAASVDRELAKLPQGNGRTFAMTIVPALKPARMPQAILEAHTAMLATAADIVTGGPQKLVDSKDPFGAGPFVYTEQPNGFVLKSKLVVRGKPVMLTVGS